MDFINVNFVRELMEQFFLKFPAQYKLKIITNLQVNVSHHKKQLQEMVWNLVLLLSSPRSRLAFIL